MIMVLISFNDVFVLKIIEYSLVEWIVKALRTSCPNKNYSFTSFCIEAWGISRCLK